MKKLLALAIGLSAALAASAVSAKPLVVYFSQPEDVEVDLSTNDYDSGASVVVRDGVVLGSTQYLAQIIAEQTGADLYRIETVQPYPLEHDALVDYAHAEREQNIHPEIKLDLQNLDEYDTVYIGYPIWTYDLPMPLYSFFDAYDLSGKTIIPFVSHGGSRLLDTVEKIKALKPNAKVDDRALAVSRRDVHDEGEEEVTDWLAELKE